MRQAYGRSKNKNGELCHKLEIIFFYYCSTIAFFISNGCNEECVGRGSNGHPLFVLWGFVYRFKNISYRLIHTKLKPDIEQHCRRGFFGSAGVPKRL